MKWLKGFKYTIVFFAATALLTSLLVCSARIPRSAIKENVQKSAEFLCEGELFGTVVEGVSGSKIDRYADSILLAIAYQYDSGQPLTSVMKSAYYYTNYQNENKNLLDAVLYDYEPNQQYLRYWHGSNAVVRPLLVFLDIRQIYVLNGILLAVLVVWLVMLLIKKKAYIPAVGIITGLVITASWFVPLSLEYTWTYLLMLLISITAVRLAFSKRWNGMGYCFLIAGMLTAYMDFLSTETLTLTVPLLLVLWIERNRCKEHSFSHAMSISGSAVMAWGSGYAGIWIMKWTIASVVLRENVMPYVSGHIAERLGGDIGIGRWRYITGALWRNIKCLFPAEYGELGWLAAIVLLAAVFYVGYVYRKKDICQNYIFLYMAVGMIPYIRYLVLHNHSYLHFFFTYRAQMAGVAAAVMILEEAVEWRSFIRGNVRKRKS